MLLPAMTGSGESVLVIAISAFVIAVVDALPVLLPGVGSFGSPAATALFEIVVLFATPLFTLTTIWNVAVSALATSAFEKMTLPVPPTAGALVDQPVPLVTEEDTNVVLVGVPSVTVTFVSL